MTLAGGDALTGAGGDWSAANEGSASAPAVKPVWTLDQVIANYTRWDLAWSNSRVTYAFLNAAPSGSGVSSADFSVLTAEEKAFVRAAFDLISDVANITFVEAADNGSSNNRITFGSDGGAESYEWGHTSYRSRAGYPRDALTSAQIWLNPDSVGVRKWIYNGYNFQALTHEILHAIGAPHPGEYNADGSSITYANSAEYMQDSRQYSIMSYFDASNTGADFVLDADNAIYSSSTLLLHDVAGIQAIYGANMATRAGDTVYGYNSTAGRPSYDFTQNKAPIFTIWDGGGEDTLDFSLTTHTVNLNLNAGAFSDAFTLTGNISIAYGVTIENAIGGVGADSLRGNAAANRLLGGAGDDVITGEGGNDVIDGGAGTDTAVYSGAKSDYTWLANGDGGWTIRDARSGSPDGTDTLAGVEKLKFSDGVIALNAPSTSTLDAGFSVASAFYNLLRYNPVAAGDAALVSNLTAQLSAGQITQAAAIGQLVDKAIDTTAVAVLTYQFFTGATLQLAGYDYLLSPTGPNANNLNSAYYAQFNVENRYINFAVNLGREGAGHDDFVAAYGAKSMSETLVSAYSTIFGAAPTAATADLILNASIGGGLTRTDYFHSYGVDDIGTKAAMIGWLLSEAAKADIGVYALSANAYLADVALNGPSLVDLVGSYGQASYIYQDSYGS